jgi:hypothetical protein
LGPKIIKAITMMTINSGIPIPNITSSLDHFRKHLRFPSLQNPPPVPL